MIYMAGNVPLCDMQQRGNDLWCDTCRRHVDVTGLISAEVETLITRHVRQHRDLQAKAG